MNAIPYTYHDSFEAVLCMIVMFRGVEFEGGYDIDGRCGKMTSMGVFSPRHNVSLFVSESSQPLAFT